MEKGVYFSLQVKRAFKLYPSIIIVTLLVVAGIVLTAVGILGTGSSEASSVNVRAGVVGDVEGSYLGLGVEAIKKMDSSRSYIDLVNMTEDEAKKALNKGEITGYVYIPKGFIEDVTTGEDVSLKYISLDDPGAINALVEQEVVTTVSAIVTESQKAIYGAIDIGKDYNQKNVYKKINVLNKSYITVVLNRDSIYELVTIEGSSALSYGGYYFCALIVFFLLIWGVSCNRIINDNEYELSGILNLRGVGFIRQFFARFWSFFIITYVTLNIFAIIFGFAASVNDFGISEIIGADVITSVAFIIKILPVVFMFLLMHMALCEIFKGVGGLLAQFIIMIILGYLSGIFYPTSFFPQSIQVLMEFLPVGSGFMYIKNALLGTWVFKYFCLCFIYGILFFVLSVCVRKHKVLGGAKI